MASKASERKAPDRDIESQWDILDFALWGQDKGKSVINETKKIYAKQCPGLSDDQEQRDLWRTLAIGRENNFPLLPLVIDSFSRDRLEYYMKKRGSLQLGTWVCYIPLRVIIKFVFMTLNK